jgi:WD40 repeat protein
LISGENIKIYDIDKEELCEIDSFSCDFKESGKSIIKADQEEITIVTISDNPLLPFPSQLSLKLYFYKIGKEDISPQKNDVIIEGENSKDVLPVFLDNKLIFIAKRSHPTDLTDHQDEKIFIWNLRNKQKEITNKHNYIGQGNRVLSISPNGKFWAIGNIKGKITIYDQNLTLVDEKISAHGTPKESPVNALAFTKDNKILASGGDDCNIKLWNMKKLKQQEGNILGEHNSLISAIIFDQKGNLLASGDDGGIIKVWNLQTKKENVLERHTSKICQLSFSSDSRFLLSVSKDKKMIIWKNNI